MASGEAFTVVKLTSRDSWSSDLERLAGEAELEYCSNLEEANRIALSACKLYATVMIYLSADTSKPVFEFSNVHS